MPPGFYGAGMATPSRLHLPMNNFSFYPLLRSFRRYSLMTLHPHYSTLTDFSLLSPTSSITPASPPSPLRFSLFTRSCIVHTRVNDNINNVRSHYPKRASVLDIKDAATPRIGHSYVYFIYLYKYVFCI